MIALDAHDQALLSGAEGPAMQMAMRLVLRAAEIIGAKTLVPVSFAHIDACFYTGQAHVDFAQYLLDHGARLAIPAWTNNGLVSLANPELRPEQRDPEAVQGARKLMQLYEKIGCKPVWTCAPYQLPGRPKLGQHIVAGESNAVTFYNSVIGARTNKYGDYLDVACALIGKAPFAGLHTDEGRRGDLLFRTGAINSDWKREDIFFHLLGYHIGRIAGTRVPVIEDLPANASEDNLKAVSAAVAASGGVELWHGVGVTPEAPCVEAVFSGSELHEVTPHDLAAARDALSSGRDGPLDMVALGTPHFSPTEFANLAALLNGRKIKPGLIFYVSTSRFVRELAKDKGWIEALEKAGVTIVTDICTYYSPAVRGCQGRVMTNAAKWAYYAPGMLGVEVCFGSLKECVESAVRGEVWRDPQLWKALAA
jgi:predicted aconitase